MEIKRTLSEHLHSAKKYYPVLSVAGPRQAGKSTLLKMVFSNYTYISLEDPDTLAMITADPRGFFESNKEGIIIDEAQKMPEIFSYLQGIVDREKENGKYILSGSQNFLMHKHVSQSLAGRVDLSTLFPLDFSEMETTASWDKPTEEIIRQGFYPGKIVRQIPEKMFYKNYIRTYIERDVTDLIHVGNVSSFRAFLKVLAHRCGTQLNMSHLSNEVNVAVNTIKSWISILESSYIIFLLPSYHKNLGKRLVKSPKVYFYDTGLLCYLLELFDADSIKNSHRYGALFENLVIAEKKKFNAHRQSDKEMYFFRDNNGLEVDLLEDTGEGLVNMYELKGGSTFKTEFLTNMKKLQKIDPGLKMNVIFNGNDTLPALAHRIINWRKIHQK